ncbi:FCD domain-containing protein [Streptomyces sp. Ncost-T10-10d]|nr:FCD domain-containing protein [Streptomyces sp. Ncost-T10-10d]
MNTAEDLAALDAALTVRRAAGAGGDAEFVDVVIALRRAVVVAAHNPVLPDLFGEFAPALRQGLIDLVELFGLRREDPHHGDAGHDALVRAVVADDAESAGRAAQTELESTPARLRAAWFRWTPACPSRCPRRPVMVRRVRRKNADESPTAPAARCPVHLPAGGRA